MKKLISNIAIIIALVVTSVSYSNAQKLIIDGAVIPLIQDSTNNYQFNQVYNNGTKTEFSTLTTNINQYVVVMNSVSLTTVEILDITPDSDTSFTTLKIKTKAANNVVTDLFFKIKTKTTPTSTASVKEVEVSNFSVYPNPVVDVLNIKFDAYEDVDVVVMDMSGRIVYNEPTSTMTTVNMSDQPSGMYLVKIGNQTQNFIKK